MLQIQALLDQFREWRASDPGRQGQVTAMLFDILVADSRLSMARAPAHPDEMRAWLISTISEQVDAAVKKSDSPVLTIQFNNLMRFLPLVLANTEPSDWPPLAAELDGIRAMIAYSKDDRATTQSILEDSQVQELLRELGGFFVKGSGWARKRVEIAMQDHWRWPLSIVVDDAWLDDRRVQRLGQVLDRLGVVRLVPHGSGQPGAIRVIAGDADEVLGALGSADRDRYAYVLGTGTLDHVGDLNRIANRARSVGAAMLGWDRSTVMRRLVPMLAGIVRGANGGDTLDIWLNRFRDDGFRTFYAYADALEKTAPRQAGNLLVASVKRQIFDRKRAGNPAITDFSVDVDSLSTTLLDEYENRPIPDRGEDLGIWLRRVGELTHATMAAGLLRTTREIDLIDESVRGIDTLASPARSVGPAEQIASTPLDDYARRVPNIDIGSGFVVGAFDRKPEAPAPLVSRSREVVAQATLMCGGHPTHRLSATVANELHVQLGADTSQAVQADMPFPVEKLPAKDRSIRLTMSLVPLAGIHDQYRGVAQSVDCRFSKVDARSDVCRFPLLPAQDAIEYRARLLILHENRVLQSLMVHIPSSHASDEVLMRLVAENIVRSDFSSLAPKRPYDLAIVSNHDDANRNGVLLVTQGNQVEFREPKSLGGLLAAASAELKALNETADDDSTAKGRHQQLTHSLNELANLGFDMRETVCGGNPALETLTADRGDPSDPLRIQVVEAVPDAFLPVEIFYDGPAPVPGAPLCAKVASPDYPIGVCGGCIDRQRDDLICPSRFWGLSKVIERRPFVADVVSIHADYALSANPLSYEKVPSFRSIVYGMSTKFQSSEEAGIARSLKTLSKRVIAARSWTDWKSTVAKHGPEMLVAIGHVQQRENGIDALEIGDEHLRSTNVTPLHIRKIDGVAPVVILLGCGTLYAEGKRGNFVRSFSRHGAGLIVATIASMLTLQAPSCIDAIMKAFEDARASGAAGGADGHNTVGFAVLRAKQALISYGSGLGLALAGAGDSEWEF